MLDPNEESSSGEDEVVPWFTFPQQKPLFSRLRLTQRSTAGNIERLKRKAPSSLALRMSSDNEVFSTPSSSISKGGNIPCLVKNNIEAPGVTKDKLSVLDQDERKCSEGSVRKPGRVLRDILNYDRVNQPKIIIEHQKSIKDNDFQKSHLYLSKGILKNTAKPVVGKGILPEVAEVAEFDVQRLTLKDKPGNVEIGNKEPPDCNSNTNSRNSCVQCQQQNVFVVKNVEYTVLTKLGRGGSSQVFQVWNKKTSEVLALKCVDLAGADPVTAEGYLKEIELLVQLQSCRRIVKLFNHEYVKSKHTLYVVMEKGETDLSTFLKQSAKVGEVSVQMITYYWTEMLLAVKEIHKHGIVHADLKPANFLLVCGRLKLIDFGIASAMQNDVTSIEKNSIAGTGNYISPEAVQDPNDCSKTKVGYKSDVWSLGCILYSMLYGKTPFQHIPNNFVKLTTIANPKHRIDFPPPPEGCPMSLANAVRQCLRYDAKQRPTVDQLLAMKY